MEPYATYANFTAVYSAKGINEAEINSAWLPYGFNRVNEELAGFYTIPFSSNNATARSLNVDFAYLGILIRTRNTEDSEELKEAMERRTASLTSSGAPMLTDSGETIFPSGEISNVFQVYSNTQDYKPVFDMRDSEYQRVDPDQLDDEWLEDL